MEGKSVSIIEVYNPKFDDFHGKPTVTWQEGRGPIQAQVNMLDQYRRWRGSKLPKHEPCATFWESRGPEIVRALGFIGGAALVFEYVSDRKVAYKWFGRKPDDCAGSGAYCLCPISAEGGTNGSDSRVTVVLPTDEEVHFMFNWTQMEAWRKPKLIEYACVRCMRGFADKAQLDAHASTICEPPISPDLRFGEG